MTPPQAPPIPAPEHRSRLRGPLISLGVLVALLAAGELAVRLFTDTYAPLLVVDAAIGRRYVSDFQGTIHDPESGNDIPVSFNSVGFRFEDRPVEKPPGHRRVVVLGDSMIAALQVPSEESAVSVAERELNEDPSAQEVWEVMNFGVSGSGTFQEYLRYREVARAYQPDHVFLVFFMGNDFMDNSPRLSHLNRLYYDFDEQGNFVRLPYPSTRIRLNEFLNRNLRLYVWQKEFLAGKAREEQHGDEVQTLEQRHAWHGEHVRASEYIYLTGPDETTEHAWALTRAAIEALARDVHEDGAVLTVALLPSSQVVHREEFEYLRSVAGELADRMDPEHPGRMLREISERAGARFLDLTPIFREAAPSRSEMVPEEWLFLNGGGHLNVAGNALVARALAAEARAVRAQ